MNKSKKIVIVGGGFGGLNVAKKLKDNDVEIILIDKTNHHLFQPLLYQVATAAVSPGDIAKPIRGIFTNQKNVKVILDEAVSVNKTNNTIELRENGILNFDALVLAVGSKQSYFGNDNWEKYAPGLKTLNDALTIRENILYSFEKAELIDNEKEREKYITFVVVGGGPTGVEMAGAIAEIAKQTMLKDFRNIDPAKTKIYLIEAGNALLGVYPPELTSYTKETLEEMGVIVQTKTMVKDINEKGVETDKGFIETENIIWSAGNKASPVLNTLDIEMDKGGRVIVENDLSIKDNPNIFVIGDAAHVKDEKGNPLPALAPVAMQEGEFVAEILKTNLSREYRNAFKYFDKGSMATIGKAKAVAQIRDLKLKGFFAWLMWCFVHVMFLIGFRNKIAVMFEWSWLYISNHRTARLIIKKK